MFQDKGHELDYTSMAQEDAITRYLQEHAITRFPAIDFINKISLRKERQLTIDNEIYREVKDDRYYGKDTKDYLDYESQHITHQYFPYRQSGLSNRIKSYDMRKTKNIFTYKIKKSKHQSCSPTVHQKNYIFWNQRKLISNDVKSRSQNK